LRDVRWGLLHAENLGGDIESVFGKRCLIMRSRGATKAWIIRSSAAITPAQPPVAPANA
jgi:hypothetical protein